MTMLLSELEGQGQHLGLISIGYDGERTDSLNPLILKPPIRCPAGTLVATTDTLVRRSKAASETLVDTGLRTPLGTVSIFRLMSPAEIEVAGPSSASGAQEAAAAMLELGAERVIVDGSIDRRATAAPEMAEAVITSTGAVLGSSEEEVAAITEKAIELSTLPVLDDRRLRDRLNLGEGCCLLVGPDGAKPLPPTLPLTASTRDLREAGAFEGGRDAAFYVPGSVPESFLAALIPLVTPGPLKVVAENPTRIFLRERSPRWYGERGVRLEVLNRAEVRAISVNPVAPLSHELDSPALREAISCRCPGLPVFDVAAPDYSAPA